MSQIERIGTGPRMSEAVTFNGIAWLAGQVGTPGKPVAAGHLPRGNATYAATALFLVAVPLSLQNGLVAGSLLLGGPPVAQAAAGPLASASPSAPARIEIVDLVKTYQREGGANLTPVNRINLTVAPDELVVLLGPSGCGKTTLLRCVAGLERPDAGEIIINGRTVFSSRKGIYVPANRREMSFVFQTYALWPHMTVG